MGYGILQAVCRGVISICENNRQSNSKTRLSLYGDSNFFTQDITRTDSLAVLRVGEMTGQKVLSPNIVAFDHVWGRAAMTPLAKLLTVSDIHSIDLIPKQRALRTLRAPQPNLSMDWGSPRVEAAQIRCYMGGRLFGLA